jgi:hypothetical protein
MNTRIIKIDGLQVDASETETEKNWANVIYDGMYMF